MLVPCGAQPRYLYPVALFTDNIHHRLIFTLSLPGCELRSCCCTWRHLLCLCVCTYRHDFVKSLVSLCACKAFYCHYWVLCTALAGVPVIQIHIHPCSWQDVIIGSENSVKSYHCRDTHTQADAEKLTPCSCRETRTL